MVEKNEEQMKEYLVKYGPLAIGINARMLQMYGKGVYNPRSCNNSINHAVLLVGYGVTAEGVKYWTIKNTWGENWGENGFFKIIRGE